MFCEALTLGALGGIILTLALGVAHAPGNVRELNLEMGIAVAAIILVVGFCGAS